MRALEQLGIEHIPSYSPEARGRMERVFGTLQNRLPPELRLAGITTQEAANRFLAKRFMADHNARFAVAAAEPGSAFVAYAGDLAEVLCVQVERVVSNDNCVRYEGRYLQIPPQRHRHHFVKVKVRVHALRGWPARGLPRPALPGPLRTRRGPCRGEHQTRRLSPLGGALGGFAGQRFALPTTPPSQQQQRTFDVLRKPDIFTCH